MARPKTDDDATKNLQPEDETPRPTPRLAPVTTAMIAERSGGVHEELPIG